MQTHEWEALLDGTADGPWEAERHGREEVISICTTVHDPKRYVGDIYGEWNARLAAHAPAAVAEVIRLRREIEAVRDDYQRNAEADNLLSQFNTVPLIPVFNDLANALTHILEGDNNA